MKKNKKQEQLREEIIDSKIAWLIENYQVGTTVDPRLFAEKDVRQALYDSQQKAIELEKQRILQILDKYVVKNQPLCEQNVLLKLIKAQI